MQLSHRREEMSVNVFIFRRDLRIEDNRALIRLSKLNSKPIIPIFIYNPQQVDPAKNKYYSSHAFSFMLECLHDIKDTLYFFEGDDISVLSKIHSKLHIEAIGFNRDHTPFAKQRDSTLISWCNNAGIPVVSEDDYVLFSYGDKRLRENGAYEVYTPFYRQCVKLLSLIEKPNAVVVPQRRWYKSTIQGSITLDSIIKKNKDKNHGDRMIKGGRQNALHIINAINKGVFESYDITRNFPSLDKTTKLSAYLKFGCVSIREAFWVCLNRHNTEHGLVRELLWREFYAHITWHIPRVLQGEPMKLKYIGKKIWIDDGAAAFKAWCEGRTGFPFVDAGMRCLVKTGFLHNRLRMVVAMFLVKDLLVDWRQGEMFFAKHLVDYDPASNSGGWQWAASIGADAQPYYRIFNPWLQSAKFDRDALFIKTYIPELTQVPSKSIHKWNEDHINYYHIKYPSPIVDHKIQSKKALRMFTTHK